MVGGKRSSRTYLSCCRLHKETSHGTRTLGTTVCHRSAFGQVLDQWFLAGGFAKGYKLHAIWGGGWLPSAWRIESMNVGDSTAAHQMIQNLPGEGYIVGDSQFDSNALHATAWPAHQVIAQQQRPGKGLGHRWH